jgi:integrase
MVAFRNSLLSEREVNGAKVKALSINSVLSYLNSLSAFFTWAKRRHYITEHPIDKEVRITGEKREVPNFTYEQITTLLDLSLKMRNRDAPKGATPMYDILRFLMLSGFRITEATNLEWRDIHFDDGYISVMSKDGKRPDLYPLNLELRTFLESLPHHYAPHVFLYRSKSHPGRWVRGVVKKMQWGKYREPINERDDPSQEGRLSVHTLRKNFGTYWAERGMPLHKLQELMRHRKISTTQTYYLKLKVDENRTELNRRESLLAHVEGIRRSA